MAIFIIVPIGFVFRMAFSQVTKAGLIKGFAGFDNFSKVLGSSKFTMVLKNTVVWTVLVVVLSTVLGFILALILNNRFKGRKVARAIVVFPWATTLVIQASAWKFIISTDYGALNTLLMIFAMAFGIAFAIQVCHIDNFVKDLTMTPHHEYWEFAIAAAVSAMGFSTIFSIPRRLLPVVAVGGIIAVCFRNFVNLGPSNGNIGLDMGLSIGSLAGSALISIIVIKARHWFHTPHQCITIPSVIPMVPGVLMYRALFAFIDIHGVIGEVTVGMNNLIKASLAIICIALGVAIPNVFFRRFIADNRKRKLLAMLVERKKKNGEFVDLHEVEIK